MLPALINHLPLDTSRNFKWDSSHYKDDLLLNPVFEGMCLIMKDKGWRVLEAIEDNLLESLQVFFFFFF